MSLTPAIAIHLTAALSAVALGPFALWARLGRRQRPRLHRAFGYAWVTLMTLTALSALFIRGTLGPRLYGFGLIHLLIPVTLGSLVYAFRQLLQLNFVAHRSAMLKLYIYACVITGAFTLLPGRLLGDLVWGRWLGLL